MLKIKEFDDVIRHIENKGYNSAIILLRAMKHDAESAESPVTSANTRMPSALQINHVLRHMESSEKRLLFIADILSGICRHCGDVKDVCYCMCDD